MRWVQAWCNLAGGIVGGMQRGKKCQIPALCSGKIIWDDSSLVIKRKLHELRTSIQDLDF